MQALRMTTLHLENNLQGYAIRMIEDNALYLCANDIAAAIGYSRYNYHFLKNCQTKVFRLGSGGTGYSFLLAEDLTKGRPCQKAAKKKFAELCNQILDRLTSNEKPHVVSHSTTSAEEDSLFDADPQPPKPERGLFSDPPEKKPKEDLSPAHDAFEIMANKIASLQSQARFLANELRPLGFTLEIKKAA